MKFARTGILFAITFTLLVGSTACSSGKKKSPEAQKNQIPTLQVYIQTGDSLMVKAINQYNETYAGKSKVQEVTFSDYEELSKKITTELLAGAGPDLIRVDPHVFPALHKVVASGAFSDLNPLIEGSKEINIADYYGKVLERGVFCGKRYLIPLGFDTPVFYTSQEILERNNIVPDLSNWTWGRLADPVLAHQKMESKERKYFFDGLDFFDILHSSGISFVDYDKKESHFRSSDFVEMLELYKKIYPSILPADQQVYTQAGITGGTSLNEDGLEDPSLMDYLSIDAKTVSNKNGVLFNGKCWGFGDPEFLRAINTGFVGTTGEKMKVLPFPTWNGEKNSYIEIGDYIGINSQSSLKKEALQFIKILLDRDLDWNRPGTDKSPLSQMNKKAYKGKQNRQFDKLIFTSPLPKELADNMDAIIGGIGDTVVYDVAIDNIIYNELQEFMSGKKSAEETAKVIDDKVNLYLNE